MIRIHERMCSEMSASVDTTGFNQITNFTFLKADVSTDNLSIFNIRKDKIHEEKKELKTLFILKNEETKTAIVQIKELKEIIFIKNEEGITIYIQ